MFGGDGSLDPLLKFLLHAVIALAVGKVFWEWLTEDVGQWITVDLWGLIADHPWWTGLFVVGGLPMLLLLGRILSFLFGAHTCANADDTFAAPSSDAIEADALTFKMKQLSSMSATGFEQACTDLLARDGFRRPKRVGGAGDLGVDVTARDDEDRLLIVQCTQYRHPKHDTVTPAHTPQSQSRGTPAYLPVIPPRDQSGRNYPMGPRRDQLAHHPACSVRAL